MLEEERKKSLDLQEKIAALSRQLARTQEDTHNMNKRVLKEAQDRRTAELQLEKERIVWKNRQEKTRLLFLDLVKLAQTGTEEPSGSSSEVAPPIVEAKQEPQN